MADVKTVILDASAIADAAGTVSRPGSIAVAGGRITAAGEPGKVRREVGDKTAIRNLAGRLILPALVNAHAHLDLTLIGPKPYPGGFLPWVEQHVVPGRPGTDAQVAAAVQQGAAMSHAAGVGVIGDIAVWPNDLAAAEALRRSPLRGVSFVEMLGRDEALEPRLTHMKQLALAHDEYDRVRVGLQPHAVFSTAPAVYQTSAELARDTGIAVTTHLAETRDELQFVARGTGPIREYCKRRNNWNESWLADYGRGQSPVHWMKHYLQQAHWLVAHCNYVDDNDIELLAKTSASVAYCPVASEYFGHRRHRYREMIEAGINVCLGTDSILCQPDDQPQPMGIVPQMRHLYQRDRTDPRVLLKMATINGCHALDIDVPCATLQPGAPADLVSVPFDPADPTDALTQVLQNRYPVEPVIKVEAHT